MSAERVKEGNVASTLDALASYAQAFDAISDADGARYSATAFVKWIKLEIVGTSRPPAERTGHPSESGPRSNGAASTVPTRD